MYNAGRERLMYHCCRWPGGMGGIGGVRDGPPMVSKGDWLARSHT